MSDPRAAEEAKKILETSNDTAWNCAAIRVLGALGAKELAPKFLGFIGDWKNPLATAAVIALANVGDPQALPKIREALAARGDEVIIAGTQAARRLLVRPGVPGDATRDQLASLLADAAALETLEALNDARLDRALAVANTDATLEGTQLLARIERLMSERKVKLL